MESTGDEAAMAEAVRWAWWMPASLACLLRAPATAAQREQKPDPLRDAEDGRLGGDVTGDVEEEYGCDHNQR